MCGFVCEGKKCLYYREKIRKFFLVFGKKSNCKKYFTFQISPNGFITFFDGSILNPSTPTPFPRLLPSGMAAPQIAIYHTDLLFTNHMMSRLTYQMHRNGVAISQIQNDIMSSFGKSFTPTRVLAVTWKYAEPFDAVIPVSVLLILVLC